MKSWMIMPAMAVMWALQSANAQQVNVVINNQWSGLYAEAQQMPHVVFSSSFQTMSGSGFATPWMGNRPFCLSISENPFDFSTDAQILTPEDVKQNRQGTRLFSLPRNVQAAAQILHASGWRFYYALDGYHVTLLIESIWMDPSQIVRCKGYVVVTADPGLTSTDNRDAGLTDKHVEQLGRLADLRDRGILTEEEFAREKEQILNNR